MNESSSQMDVIRKLSSAIAKAKAPAEVYDLIVDELARSLNVERVSLMIFDPEKEGLVIAAAKGLDKKVADKVIVRLGEGISGKVFSERRPMMVEDVKAEQRGAGKYHTSSLMSAPVTCSPMKMGDDPIGVINVTDRIDKKPFSEGDLNLLSIVADVAASYVHLTTLAGELRKVERLKQELEIARNIQYRLLPARPPDIKGLDISGRCLTAERVGGDYYDYFIRKKPAFAVADVSGHSIGAAIIMAAFRAAIRSSLSAGAPISSCVDVLNSILFEDLFQAEQFVSLAIVEYDEDKKEAHFTTAGHPPVLIWRSSAGKMLRLSTDDPLIGIDSRAEFKSGVQKVLNKDVLLLYSDGLPEAVDSKGKRFGMDLLEQTLIDLSPKPAAEIAEGIESRLLDFIHPMPLKDDVTLIAIKVV